MSSLLGLNQDGEHFIGVYGIKQFEVFTFYFFLTGEMQDKECQKEIYEILPNITIDTDR